MTGFLTEHQRESLKRVHKLCKNKRHADRIKAVLLRDKRYSFEEIASILLLDDSTIRQFIKDYEEFGVDKLCNDDWKGREGKLTQAQEKELKLHIVDNFYLVTKEIIHYVKEKYSVIYTERGMNDLLHRLGFVYKKPKRTPGKANEEKQDTFIAEYRSLKEQKKEHEEMQDLLCK